MPSRAILLPGLIAVAILSALSSAHSALLFTENFNYTVGSNLAGQNGGSGFSGAWSGGNSTIVGGLGGTGNAVQIGSSIASRSLSSTFSTSGNTFYISYLMNVSNFSGGKYTGISLWNGATEQVFFGIPWEQEKFGFDARSTTGVAGIKTINFTPATNTTYLITFGLLPSATSGKVDLKMWATSDLGVDPNTLVSGAANASLLGTRDNFNFNTVKLNGDYAGNLKVSGIGSAPTASEAIDFSKSSVPEPGTWAAAAGEQVLLGGLDQILAGAELRGFQRGLELRGVLTVLGARCLGAGRSSFERIVTQRGRMAVEDAVAKTTGLDDTGRHASCPLRGCRCGALCLPRDNGKSGKHPDPSFLAGGRTSGAGIALTLRRPRACRDRHERRPCHRR